MTKILKFHINHLLYRKLNFLHFDSEIEIFKLSVKRILLLNINQVVYAIITFQNVKIYAIIYSNI